MPHLGRPRERLFTGLRWGFVYAAACSAVALASILIRGPGVLRPYHVGVLGVIALYFASGIVGGSVFGLLMPIGQTLGGAALLGWLVMIPVAALISIVVAPDLRPGARSSFGFAPGYRCSAPFAEQHSGSGGLEGPSLAAA